jgi:hypothetical protein
LRVLIDTHVLLWFLAGDSRLSPQARAAVESAETLKFFSIASLWEIAQLRPKTFSTHRVANATAVESLNFPLASVVPFPACASVTGGPPRPGAESTLPPSI